MAKTRAVDILLKARDQASKEIDKSTGALGKLGGMAKTLALGALAGLVTALGAVGTGAIKLFTDFSKAELQFETFEKLSNSMGASYVQSMTVMESATRGMVNQQDLATAGSKFMSMGIAKTTEELGAMSSMAVGLGSAMGLDATQAMDDFAMMMANQSIPRLDSFGISSSAVRQEIEALMDADKSLTREQAFQTAVINQGTEAMNKLGLSVITTFDSLDSLEGLNTSQLFSVLTAEWDNLKIALGKGLKGVFGDDVDNVLTNLITRIREFDPLADDGFFMKLKEGWQIAKVVFDNLNTKFEDVKSGFAEGGLSGALEGLIGEDMMTKLTEFFDLFDFTPITEAIQPLKDAWDGLKQSFIDSFPMIQEAGGKFGEFFSTTLAPAFINIFNSLISAVGGFIEFLTTGLENLSAFWDTWGADIITFVESTVEILSGAWTSAQEVFTTVTDAMMQVLNGDFGGAWETLKTGISDAFDTMKQTLEGAKDDWIEAGKNLLQGLADGINEKVTDVVEGAKEAGRKVLEGLKGILGIESPSKVARYYGQMTMEGYNLGLEDVEAGTLTQDLFRTDTFKSIVNTSVAENKGMTRGSSSSNSSNINFTYAPFISTADEDEAVRVLEPVVIRAVNKGSRRGKIR